jgi:hypothetical protein
MDVIDYMAVRCRLKLTMIFAKNIGVKLGNDRNFV